MAVLARGMVFVLGTHPCRFTAPFIGSQQELEKRCLSLDKREEAVGKKDKAAAGREEAIAKKEKAAAEHATLLDARERAATERERSAAEKDVRLQKREEQLGQQAGTREQQLAVREAAAAAKDVVLKDQEKKHKVGVTEVRVYCPALMTHPTFPLCGPRPTCVVPAILYLLKSDPPDPGIPFLCCSAILHCPSLRRRLSVRCHRLLWAQARACVHSAPQHHLPLLFSSSSPALYLCAVAGR